MEVLGESPWVVIDGAHNVVSAQALATTLLTCFPASPRTLVFGTTRDKDLTGQLRALLPLFDTVIATRYVENPRSVPPEDIALAIAAIDGRTARTHPGSGGSPRSGSPRDWPSGPGLRDRLALPGRRDAGPSCSGSRRCGRSPAS